MHIITTFAVVKKRTVILFLLFAFIFMMASTNVPFFKNKKKVRVDRDSTELAQETRMDSIAGLAKVDTTKMDSVQLAIYHHNKIIDDSLALDSLNRKKKKGIDKRRYTINCKFKESEKIVLCISANTFFSCVIYHVRFKPQ